jgi:hypothetical protein
MSRNVHLKEIQAVPENTNHCQVFPIENQKVRIPTTPTHVHRGVCRILLKTVDEGISRQESTLRSEG